MRRGSTGKYAITTIGGEQIRAFIDPHALIRVMEALAQASGRRRQPEFLSILRNPQNRNEKIKEAIEAEFPAGLPEGLTP